MTRRAADQMLKTLIWLNTRTRHSDERETARQNEHAEKSLDDWDTIGFDRL